MPFDPYSAGAGAVGAIAGGIASHSAAQAQQAAALEANRMARSNYLLGIQTNEVPRSLGYQAYGDIADEFGYAMPEYQSQNSLMATMNPLSAKQVKQMLHQGMSLDQIGQAGTLSAFGPKAIKRLTRAGLTIDQIHQLATRQSPGGNSLGTPASQRPAGHGFIDSPDYEFRRDEGDRNVGNQFAAKGGAASGNALRALAEFNSNLASNEFGNWFNRRMQLSGRGDQANQNVQSAGNLYSNNYQQNTMAAGDARASGVLGVAGAIQGGLSSIAGGFGGGGYGGGYGQPQASGNSGVRQPDIGWPTDGKTYRWG